MIENTYINEFFNRMSGEHIKLTFVINNKTTTLIRETVLSKEFTTLYTENFRLSHIKNKYNFEDFLNYNHSRAISGGTSAYLVPIINNCHSTYLSRLVMSLLTL